jgi:hypothetical protein
MSGPISSLGIFHTAVSVVAIGAGFASLIRDRKIDQRNPSGKIYLASMLVASLTAFGITPHGFRIGHILTLGILGLLATGMLASKISWLGRAAPYVETAGLTTTFFLLMVFATGETLTRLPVSQPIAASFDAPVLKAVHGGLLVAFALGLGYQLFTLRGPAVGPTDK